MPLIGRPVEAWRMCPANLASGFLLLGDMVVFAARPVWLELHGVLVEAAGLTRTEEAQAGHA